MAATSKKKNSKSKSSSKSITYSEAGVDIDQGDALVDHLKKINPAIGGFSGLMSLPRGYKNPRLVAATDGVGTKLLVAQASGRHDSIGIDLVAMNVNDLICCGAKPIFFLDYLATGKLKDDEAKAVLEGVVEGCEQAGCPLIGGETAEMPGMYAPGHYDLAGFCVGVVEADKVVDGSKVQPGDVVIGLASSGIHSNGYSLARKALVPEGTNAEMRRAMRKKLYKGGPTVGEAMLEPTRIYVKSVLDIMKRYTVNAAAHITGGGLAGNLVRVLPKGVKACIESSRWSPPPIFEAIATQGPVDNEEMFKVFNMGIGFTLVVPESEAAKVLRRLDKLGETAAIIGWIDKGRTKTAKPQVLVLES